MSSGLSTSSKKKKSKMSSSEHSKPLTLQCKMAKLLTLFSNMSEVHKEIVTISRDIRNSLDQISWERLSDFLDATTSTSPSEEDQPSKRPTIARNLTQGSRVLGKAEPSLSKEKDPTSMKSPTPSLKGSLLMKLRDNSRRSGSSTAKESKTFEESSKNRTGLHSEQDPMFSFYGEEAAQESQGLYEKYLKDKMCPTTSQKIQDRSGSMDTSNKRSWSMMSSSEKRQLAPSSSSWAMIDYSSPSREDTYQSPLIGSCSPPTEALKQFMMDECTLTPWPPGYEEPSPTQLASE